MGNGAAMQGAQKAAALAALEFLLASGADEAIADIPADRYGESRSMPGGTARPGHPPGRAAGPPAAPPEAAPPAGPLPAPGPPAGTPAEAVHGAREIAAACTSLEALRDALATFEGCALKRGARSCVFADGTPAARLMIIGEAPGREEDMRGLPFVGRSGQLLDRMLGAIGLSRDHPDPARAAYITNVLPWRPPQNREPSSDEIAMMTAFLIRHIELADPQILLLMGRSAAATLLGSTSGITRLRGRWHEVMGRPAMPTFHPAALLRNPLQKRPVWADLLALQARMETLA